MSKHPKRKRTVRIAAQPAAKTRIGISLLGIVLGIATLIGGFVAVLTLLQRVTATISDPVDSGNRFSSSITVANTGYIPLRLVEVLIAMRDISLVNASGHTVSLLGSKDFGSQFRRLQWKQRDLGLDDRFTVPLNDVITGSSLSLLGADIAVIVVYKLPVVFMTRRKVFPIYARRQSNGNFYWYADVAPSP